MSEDVLTCRESGHYFPWRNAVRERLPRENGEPRIQTVRTCECCKSERVDVYHGKTLRLVRRHYRLTEGYSTEPGSGRVTREAVRAELLTRFT